MNAATAPAEIGLSTRRFNLPGGLALTADLAGPAQARPTLLLHGGGQTRGAWRECMTLLAARGQRVVVPDLRGHGESDWAPDCDYALDAQINDILALIDMLPAKPVLVGASLGGLIGMTLAGEHPQALQGLVLVDIVPHVDSSGRERIIGFMKAHAHGFVSLREAADRITAYLPHRKRRLDLTGIERNLRLGLDGRYYWHWDPKFFDSFETDLPASQARYKAAVRSITVPTLMVRGMMSDLVREAGVREFRELCPHAEVADVTDATHMVVGDRNDAFTAAIVDFLGRV